jgi:uncharacterized protein
MPMTEDEVMKFINAAAGGDVAATRHWLALGAPIQIAINESLTFVKLIASTRHTEVLRVLLEHGADPNESYGEDGSMPLHTAVIGGHLRSVELLITHGADVHAPGPRGESPLRVALTMKNATIARRLCELGADPDRPDAGGITDRMVAAYENIALPPRQAMPAVSGGPLRPPSGAGSAAAVGQALRGMPWETVETMWRVLVASIRARALRGEITAERAHALERLTRDFDRARALPDLEDRTLEMQRVMAELNAMFLPERKG